MYACSPNLTAHSAVSAPNASAIVEARSRGRRSHESHFPGCPPLTVALHLFFDGRSTSKRAVWAVVSMEPGTGLSSIMVIPALATMSATCL